MAALSLAATTTLFAAEVQRVEDLFPAQVKLEVKRKPLEEEKKAYLRQFGISDQAIDLYGDIFVNSYASEHFRWGDLQPDDLGPTPVTAYDTIGMREIKPYPAPGVHPRLLFQESDRVAHLDRLQNTKAGREAMKTLMAFTELLKGRYDKNADYAQPDIFNGGWGTHGFLEFFRYAYSDGWDAYSQGKTEGIPTLGKKDAEKKLGISPGLLALEAYRCWLYEDAEGAKKVATATETYLKEVLAGLEAGKKPQVRGGLFNLNYIYDIIYNWLTEDQRELFRGVIIANMHDSNQYGMFQDARNTTSNWTTFGYQFFSVQGIQGDPGDHALHYAGFKRAMENYFTYGWFKGGACFEAFGKNQLGGDILYGMALRGDNIVAHPHVLACVRDYLPHAIVPWGESIVAYDRWGGLKDLNTTDLVPIKNLYPDDKRMDWVYRNAVKNDYSWMHRIAAEGWGNPALKSIILAVDYMEENDDPGKIMESESFLDPQRGLMITRSDWSKDALYMHMHTRGFSGGHVFADRSSILFGGQGRMWIPNGALSYRTRENSVVSIDGREASANSPARLLNYKRSPLATFSTADLRPTWNYDYVRLVRDGDAQISMEDARAALKAEDENRDRHFNLFKLGIELCRETFNDMSLEKEDKPQFNTPQFAKPHWLKPGDSWALVRRENDLRFTKAFRTAGMIRGENPEHSYALVLDDWQAEDGDLHTYDWLARIAPDLMLIQHQMYNVDPETGRKNGRLKAGLPVYRDILLADSADIESTSLPYGRYTRQLKAGAKALLVRVLEMNVPEETYWDGVKLQPVGEGVRLMQTGDETANTLMISAVSKQPKFKIMLYTGRIKGNRNELEHEPLTTWDDTRKHLTVKIGEQTDVISFTEADAAPTTFTVSRANGASFVYGTDDYEKGE